STGISGRRPAWGRGARGPGRRRGSKGVDQCMKIIARAFPVQPHKKLCPGSLFPVSNNSRKIFFRIFFKPLFSHLWGNHRFPGHISGGTGLHSPDLNTPALVIVRAVRPDTENEAGIPIPVSFPVRAPENDLFTHT